MTGSAPQVVRRRRASRGDGEQLHAQIVEATKELLAETGNVDEVSIRAVAQRVGVTSPSIYLHFADKEALLQAVVGDAWAGLDEAMSTAARDAPDTPIDRLCAHGRAYVRFALENPEHYRLATMDRGDKPGELDGVIASSAFSHFSHAITECMAAGIFDEGDPIPVALQLWAAAHGIASLIVAKPYLPWGDVDAMIDKVLCASSVGLAVCDLLGTPEPTEFADWLARQPR